MTISALNSARTTRRYLALLSIVVGISNAQESTVDDTIPEHALLEGADAVIGEIIIDKRNIFDLSDPEEDKWLYRWANRLHVVTRDNVITNQLLFESGDRFSGRLLDESGRLLRRNRYLIGQVAGMGWVVPRQQPCRKPAAVCASADPQLGLD